MRFNKLSALLISFFVLTACFGQRSIKIHVVEKVSKDYVSDAQVFFNDSLVGATNNYGYFAGTCAPGTSIHIGHPTFVDTSVTVGSTDSTPSGIIQIALTPLGTTYRITATAKRDFITDFGETRVSPRYLKKIPYIMGELDVLKAIQTFPGVSSSYEANSGIYVRGGNIDQTAIYLDDAPVYNIGHFYGFFSPFDGEALKSFTLFNSGLYGGFGSRGSSILDVRFREGNMTRHIGSFSLGFISSKALVEGPIIKDKLSYLGSVRFAYPGTFINFKIKNNFIDGNIKLKYTPNARNTFYLSAFRSYDVFSLTTVNDVTVGEENIDKFAWSNTTGTARWNHITRNGRFVNTVASISKFQSRAYFIESTEPDYGNQLNNLSIKSELDNFKGVLRNFKCGFSSNYYYSSPAILYYHREDTTTFQQNILTPSKAIDVCLFAQHIYSSKRKGIQVAVNFRIGIYHNLNDGYSDPILEPRIKLVKALKRYKVYAAFDKSSQYQNYVGNKQIAVPSDFWIQASKQFKGQKIYGYTIGVSRNINRYKFTSDLFYKQYLNALDVKDGAILFRNKNVLNDIVQVQSMAYGAEFLLEKLFGKFQGHASYTLSRSIRRSNTINNNEWFASNFDRTHIGNIVANYRHNKKWAWGVLALVQSGTPTTANYAYTFLYSLRNEYRLPLYYRIDFVVTKSFVIRKKLRAEWNISVFNAIFAKNRTSQYPALSSFGSLPTIPSFGIKIIY